MSSVVPGEKVFTIGHRPTSETLAPGILYHKYTEMTFIDCPGSNDTNKNNELANHTSIHNCMQYARSFKLILVINASMITNYRG